MDLSLGGEGLFSTLVLCLDTLSETRDSLMSYCPLLGEGHLAQCAISKFPIQITNWFLSPSWTLTDVRGWRRPLLRKTRLLNAYVTPQVYTEPELFCCSASNLFEMSLSL